MRSENNSSKVSEIFARIEYAANHNRPLDLDEGGSIIAGKKLSTGDAVAGRFKTLFVNDKDTAIRAAVMKNMIEESLAILPQEQKACEKLIQERVPSLGKLSYISTAIGDDPSKEINAQWKDLQSELRSKLQGKQLHQRQAMLDAMNQLLPAEMELMNMEGEVFKFQRKLSDQAQANIIDGFVELDKDQIGPVGIHDQAEKDLNRANFRFIYREQQETDGQPSEPLSIEFPPGNKERVLQHLERICGNDPTTIATVSKMLGQRALAPLVIALATDFAPRNPSEAPPVLNTRNKEEKEKLHLVYSIEQTGDGRLLVGAEYGSKCEEYADAYGVRTWAINRSSRWRGPPSAQNVALFGTYCLSVNLSDLSEGRIRPTFVKPAEGGYRIEPHLPPLSPIT